MGLLILGLTVSQGHVFLQVPAGIQNKLKNRERFWHPRIEAMVTQSRYLSADNVLGEWNYGHFKSLVETSQTTLNADEDVSKLKKMQCSCTFKKLFVNTLEKGFTDLMIGKFKPRRLWLNCSEDS